MQYWTLPIIAIIAVRAGSANLSQASFTEILKSGTISRPHIEVLDTVERFYTHRMMACSSLQMQRKYTEQHSPCLGHRPPRIAGTAWPAGSHISNSPLAQFVVLLSRRDSPSFAAYSSMLLFILCAVCHTIVYDILFVVVLFRRFSNHTSAPGKSLIFVECLLECGPCLQVNGPSSMLQTLVQSRCSGHAMQNMSRRSGCCPIPPTSC